MEELRSRLYFWPTVGNRGKQGLQYLLSGSQVGENPGGEGYTSRPFRSLGTTEGCPEEVIGERRVSER